MPATARCILRLSFVLSLVIAAGSAQTPNACASQPYCAETNDFVAVITNFRTSTVNNIKVIDATVRFQNKTNQPLTLGYVLNSGMAADDRGNRLIVGGPNGYHGIGVIAGTNFDPKFTVRPGGYRDAQFELLQQGWPKVVGLNHTLELSVAEISNLEAGQHTLGEEFPLHFQGLTNGASASVPAFGSLTQAVSAGDPCAAGATNRATATVASAANAISNIGSIFNRKKAAQNAANVANVSSGCIPAAANAAGGNPATSAGIPAAGGTAVSGAAQAQPTSMAAAPQQLAAATSRGGDIAASSASGASAEPWTPPSDATQPTRKAVPVVLDASKMPDVIGIHLGMSSQAALAAVKAHYPNNQLTIYDTNMSMFPTNVLQGVIVNPRTGYEENFDFNSTLPPDKQIVWRVHRLVNKLHVARETLLSTLREKYGKESAVVGGDARAPVTNISDIVAMLWLFDESGHHVPVPNGNLMTVLDCLGHIPNGVGNGFLVEEARGNPNTSFNGWCANSLVGVYVSFSTHEPIIEVVETTMLDLPLALRTSHSTAAWYKQRVELARKQDLEKAKQNKPSF